MKKRTVGVLTLLMILTGICAATAAATPITTLGTIDYYNTQDNFILTCDIPGNANLTHIYSEMDGSALKLDKIWYDSFTDRTTYKFTTQKIFVEWWFTPGVKEFVYIDGNNNSLYRINVNYSQIDIPENPYTKQHRELTENYTLILNSYNLTNTTLANLTAQFNELDGLYDLIMLQFNMTQKDYLNISGDLTNLTANYTILENEYDNRTALWNGAVNSSIHYETNYNDKVSDYNQLEKDHNNLAGAMPWYILLSIIGTLIITYVYLRQKNIFNAPAETTDEITTSYGKMHSWMDDHVLSYFRKEQKIGEGKIEDLSPGGETPKPPKEEFTPDEKKEIQKSIDDAKKGKITPLNVEKSDDILTAIHEKIDTNARATNIRIDAKAKETDIKIETLFKGIDERLKKIAKGTKA